jgi:hypothetical protein
MPSLPEMFKVLTVTIKKNQKFLVKQDQAKRSCDGTMLKDNTLIEMGVTVITNGLSIINERPLGKAKRYAIRWLEGLSRRSSKTGY